MTLHARLDDGARDDCVDGECPSDPRPMALTALAALGAGAERLGTFAAGFRTILELAHPPEPWPAGDAWASRLGEPAARSAYRSLFGEWLDHEGPDRLLEQTLPTLMEGVSAAAFHGPVRTAGAVAAGDAGELVAGLADWACRHEPIAVAAPRGPRLPRRAGPTHPAADDDRPASLDGVLGCLAATLAPMPRHGPIRDRLRTVVAQSAFGREVARLGVDAETLDALSRRAARLFATTGDFTALHMVIGCHAVQVLRPFFDAEGAAVGHLQRAWVAAWASCGAGLPAAAMPPTDAPPWETLVAAAIASDDPHTIQLVWSCRDLARRLGDADGVFRAAAARRGAEERR